MRKLLLLLVVTAACAAMAQTKGEFGQACASHIEKSWAPEVQKAAAADCAFYEAAQTAKTEAWVNAADENVVLPNGTHGKEALRKLYTKVYEEKGFRLLWYPTGGAAYGSFVVTSGRWERHALDANGKDDVTHGLYVTMWKKQKDGSYKFVWDDGE